MKSMIHRIKMNSLEISATTNTSKRQRMKLLYCFIVTICLSLSSWAQLAIKNSALTGDWKLTFIRGEYDIYEYDCEKKLFHMSDNLLFSLGESEAAKFEKNIIKEAGRSFFKLKANGDYELILGQNDIEKGTWKSQAMKESEEGYIPGRFGLVELTSGSELFNVFIVVEKQQLLLSISLDMDGVDKAFIFRKEFSGNAFK